MNWWKRLWRRTQMEAQLEKELSFHLEQHTSQLVARGLTPDQARRQARLALGGPVLERAGLEVAVGQPAATASYGRAARGHGSGNQPLRAETGRDHPGVKCRQETGKRGRDRSRTFRS